MSKRLSAITAGKYSKRTILESGCESIREYCPFRLGEILSTNVSEWCRICDISEYSRLDNGLSVLIESRVLPKSLIKCPHRDTVFRGQFSAEHRVPPPILEVVLFWHFFRQ